MASGDWADRIGKRVRKLRKAQQLTQQELGARLNMTRQGISDVENGGSRLTLDRLERVLDALGYDLEMFFVRQDEPE